jgi:hypothetical protein
MDVSQCLIQQHLHWLVAVVATHLRHSLLILPARPAWLRQVITLWGIIVWKPQTGESPYIS